EIFKPGLVICSQSARSLSVAARTDEMARTTNSARPIFMNSRIAELQGSTAGRVDRGAFGGADMWLDGGRGEGVQGTRASPNLCRQLAWVRRWFRRHTRTGA